MYIFISVDPLAEETMTPYQYVHNNPINLIDPTGMSAEKIIPRGMTEEQQKMFYSNIKEFSKRSFLFKRLYERLENSEKNHYIDINPNAPHGEGYVMREGTGSVLTFKSDEYLSSEGVMYEEFFHMFQNDNTELKMDNNDLNWEFEAKTFVMIASQDFRRTDDGMSSTYANKLKNDFKTDNIKRSNKSFIKNLNTKFFDDNYIDNYIKESNVFSKYNERNDYGGSSYKLETKVAPKNFRDFIKDL